MAVILRRRQRRRKRLVRSLLLLLLIIITATIILWLLFRHDVKHEMTVVSNNTQNVAPSLVTPQPIKEYFLTNSVALGNAVQNALIGTHGSYGIVVQNIKTGETYTQNSQKTYLSGSLYKLWVMATVYQQIKVGKIKDTDVVSKKVSDLNKEFHIDPSVAEKTSGTISYSVHDALYEMVTISDNYAALLLTDKVGLNNIANFLKDNGFYQSKLGINGKSPLTTPQDVALFFDKLYRGQLIDKKASESMLSLLKQQKLNDKIPKYLPFDVNVAHKTGELDDVTHDAGIVFTPNGDYIVVVLSQIDDRDLANERIANVSKEVYQYFANTDTVE